MVETYDYLKEDDYQYFVNKHSSLFKKKAEAWGNKEREDKKHEFVPNR